MSAKSDAALTTLGGLLRKPNFRKEFKADYANALRNNGVDEGSIPPKVLATLRTMGEPELTAVADLNNSLQQEQVPDLVRANMV